MKRMRFLESYCDKLLKCEMSVTQSSEVTQFFMPKDHDLQSDFTKNRCRSRISLQILFFKKKKSDDRGLTVLFLAVQHRDATV